MGEGLGMDVRGRVKTEGFIKPLALRDGCKGGVKVCRVFESERLLAPASNSIEPEAQRARWGRV